MAKPPKNAPPAPDASGQHPIPPDPDPQLTKVVTPVAAAPASGDALAGVGDNMPKPSEQVIADAQAKSGEAAKVAESVANKFPGFDPLKHEMGPDGTPAKTKAGAFRLKRGGGGGRKLAGLQSAPVAAPGAPAPIPGPTAEQLEAQQQAAAEAMTALVIAGGSIAFGPEAAAPMKIKVSDSQTVDERAGMVGAFKTYFQAKGIADVPPGLMVCVVVGSYAVNRFNMEHAKPRIHQWRSWFYSMYAKYRAWRENKYERRQVENEAENTGN